MVSSKMKRLRESEVLFTLREPRQPILKRPCSRSALLIGSCALGLGTGGQRERRLRSRVRRRRRQEPISSLVLSFALGASCKPLQAIVTCVDSDESDDDGYDETDDDDMSQYQDMCDRFLWERLVVSRFLKGVGKRNLFNTLTP